MTKLIKIEEDNLFYLFHRKEIMKNKEYFNQGFFINYNPALRVVTVFYFEKIYNMK